MDQRLWVIVAEIQEASRRRRVDEVLRAAGQRTRVGAYEVATSARGMQRLERALSVDLRDGDILRIYPICGRCRERVRLHGPGELAEEPLAWIF